jgi:transcriptional regulator with XRE-family HTH domain
MASKLARWIEARQMSLSDFAAQVETTPQTMSRIVAGKRRPSFELMGKIEAVTDGEIAGPADYLDPPDVSAPEAPCAAAVGD